MATALKSDPSVDHLLAEHAGKQLLRLVVVGSVDDGKSTLIGRLLYESGGLFDDQIASVRAASARASGGVEHEIDYALFTDGLSAEREQGITIDVAYRYFSTARRRVIVADTPGHLQYTRNMVTGASTADVAVILLDARLGVLPQTRRHATIAALLGIPCLAVAVNKMDAVAYDRAVFDRIAGEFAQFAAGLGFAEVRFFPVSAREGDNITSASERTPWHDGGTLLAWLESVPHRSRADGAPFRLSVQHVVRPHQDYRGFAGQIASGTVRVGDDVVVLPSNRRTSIAAIDTFDGSLPEASAPASVTLRLADEVDVSRGDLLAEPSCAPKISHELTATLVWFGERPLDVTRRYLVKHGARVVPAHVAQLEWRLDLEDLAEVPAATLGLNDIGKVRIHCRRALAFDSYRENRQTGAFIVIDPLSNDTVAAGMILEAVAEGVVPEDASLVPDAERSARLGQSGGVVVVPLGEGAVESARTLERRLFDAGRVAALAGSDAELALGFARAGLVAILHAPSPQAMRTLRAGLRGAGARVLELEGAQDVEGWVARISDEVAS
jgi:bifunctional enzyme CysN/CysC/sulfate adenylyltransferase subunit 1